MSKIRTVLYKIVEVFDKYLSRLHVVLKSGNF